MSTLQDRWNTLVERIDNEGQLRCFMNVEIRIVPDDKKTGQVRSPGGLEWIFTAHIHEQAEVMKLAFQSLDQAHFGSVQCVIDPEVKIAKLVEMVERLQAENAALKEQLSQETI